MLLGSFVEEYDEEDEDDIIGPGSPQYWPESAEELQRIGSLTRSSTIQPLPSIDPNPTTSRSNIRLYQLPSRSQTGQSSLPKVPSSANPDPRYYPEGYNLKHHEHRLSGRDK